MQIRAIQLGFPEREYLSLRIEMDRGGREAGAAGAAARAAFLEGYRRSYVELERRLAADPAVAGVAFADRLPRGYHPHRLVDLDEGGEAPLHPQWPAHRVSSVSVGPGFFRALRTPVLVGRDFTAADHEAGRGPAAVEEGEEVPRDARGGPVIVNEAFVQRHLGGRNPIGRRVRYRMMEEWTRRRMGNPDVPWFEIVGVVPNMGTSAQSSSEGDPKVAAIYHPVPAGAVYPGNVAVHVRGLDAAAFIPKLRAHATAADPTLRLYDVRRLSETSDAELYFLSFWFRLLILVTLVALTLSLAGIYAVMSFTVARRTREIGIRIALGATPRRVALATFRRPLTQVVLGIVTGAAVLGGMLMMASGRLLSPKAFGILAGYSLVMLAICLLACVVPTRRALRVQPTEALRYE